MTRLVTLFAILFALFGLHVTPAAATGACSVGRSYAGYAHAAQPIGSTAALNLIDVGDTLWNNGFVAGWIGVTQYSGATPVKWLQVGLAHRYGSNLAFYIESNDGTGAREVYWEPIAQYNVPYYLQIYHAGNGVWTASINGVSYTQSNLQQNSGLQMISEAFNVTSSCNAMNFSVSWSPWPTSDMTHSADYPYFITGVTTRGWSAMGG